MFIPITQNFLQSVLFLSMEYFNILIKIGFNKFLMFFMMSIKISKFIILKKNSYKSTCPALLSSILLFLISSITPCNRPRLLLFIAENHDFLSPLPPSFIFLGLDFRYFINEIYEKVVEKDGCGEKCIFLPKGVNTLFLFSVDLNWENK